jgi:hypothetical protein
MEDFHFTVTNTDLWASVPAIGVKIFLLAFKFDLASYPSQSPEQFSSVAEKLGS